LEVGVELGEAVVTHRAFFHGAGGVARREGRREGGKEG
jgi:hypothetical protein